jgi:hypothetical protein
MTRRQLKQRLSSLLLLLSLPLPLAEAEEAAAGRAEAVH